MSLVERKPTEIQPGLPVDDPGEVIRRQAIQRIEVRRRFHIEAIFVAIGAAILVLIWALSEYHNAGGWPTQGFSQSSGIHDVWNYWIIYPLMGIALIFGTRAVLVYHRKPISDREIERGIERETSDR
jgi:hypothetical protein